MCLSRTSVPRQSECDRAGRVCQPCGALGSAVSPRSPLTKLSVPAPRSSAVDGRTGTKVAIKKLYRPFQSELFAKRAYRELRLLKHMKHENVSWGTGRSPRCSSFHTLKRKENWQTRQLCSCVVFRALSARPACLCLSVCPLSPGVCTRQVESPLGDTVSFMCRKGWVGKVRTTVLNLCSELARGTKRPELTSPSLHSHELQENAEHGSVPGYLT